MTFWEIINPWGALRRAHRDLASFNDRLDVLEVQVILGKDALRMAQQRAADRENALRDTKNLLLSCRMRNDTLNRLLDNAHFRDPNTGRLGRKGETFGFIRPKGERFE